MDQLEQMDEQNGEILENVNSDKDDVSAGETMFFDIKVKQARIFQIEWPIPILWQGERVLLNQRSQLCMKYFSFWLNC